MFKKLSSSNDTHIKSGLRASLFLVPVFGIQYVFYIVPFDPFESCATYLFVIHYVLIITEALQGAMVATIFCFFNKEVLGKEFRQHNLTITITNRFKRIFKSNSKRSGIFATATASTTLNAMS